MRTCRYHFDDRPSRTLLPFLRISPERRMVEREIFPSRMSLSLVLRAKRRLFRETETPTTTFSLYSLSRFRFDRGEKTTRRVFILESFRARVFKFVDRWENSIPKSFALCLCPVLLSRPKDARKTSPASTRALSTVSQCPRISPNRVLASVKRERNDPKFVRKLLLFFPLPLFLQLSAHNFHRGLARAKRRRAARSFFSNPTHTGRRRRRRRRRRKKRTLLARTTFVPFKNVLFAVCDDF